MIHSSFHAPQQGSFHALGRVASRFYSKKEQANAPTKDQQFAQYPGAKNAGFTSKMNFIDGTESTFPIYYITDTHGNIINKKDYETVMEDVSIF